MHIDTVLLKVASRCNLDCGYCYVYHMGDDGWRYQPKRLSREVQASVCADLGDLLHSQGRPFSVVLHGGEPLLMRAGELAALFAQLRAELSDTCGISVQTNGVLIDTDILDACADHGVTISVSIDGPAEIHDRFRIDLTGKPTHAKVLAGIERLKAHRWGNHLFSGVLAVVDPTSDPSFVYDWFRDLGTPSVDFLYRDGNHDELPYGKAAYGSVEYGRWICGILDRYIADPNPFRIRMLDDMMKLLLGGSGVKEGVGLTDYGILVIDTDGSIKKNDTLKSSSPRDAFSSILFAGGNSIAQFAESEEFLEYHRAQRPSSAVCQACPILKVCGGGMMTHRFSASRGYDNPTVFCEDQRMLVERMRAHLSGHLNRVAA
ncbi:cyclophane-forming radical SAM/SPASM peptide maturase YhhB [Sphingobium sp. BS19]|uniref:cyclophane-forming radical SAM/SPASM peptide maturase YhhB n=1 Tax=Sphingobium sp. BS19 TaxID=3018973 RepID=UPI002492FC19|nr:cyclophane-forming radical SAM/SPASM peptide maturase YhhB [Sphingobium sp. BS19]